MAIAQGLRLYRTFNFANFFDLLLIQVFLHLLITLLLDTPMRVLFLELPA